MVKRIAAPWHQFSVAFFSLLYKKIADKVNLMEEVFVLAHGLNRYSLLMAGSIWLWGGAHYVCTQESRVMLVFSSLNLLGLLQSTPRLNHVYLQGHKLAQAIITLHLDVWDSLIISWCHCSLCSMKYHLSFKEQGSDCFTLLLETLP